METTSMKTTGKSTQKVDQNSMANTQKKSCPNYICTKKRAKNDDEIDTLTSANSATFKASDVDKRSKIKFSLTIIILVYFGLN